MGDESHALHAAATRPLLQVAVFAFVVVTVLVFPIVLGLGMTKGLNHDEHQHVAAGALVAREGLIPYRDFPYFHTPYLPFAYAAVFRSTDYLLTAGRLLSVLSASAILGVIGSFAYLLLVKHGKLFASLVAVGVVLLALTTTLFTETAGRAWNHEPSLILVLVAFAAQLAGMRSGRHGWFVAAGAMLGLAIGTRITCAPLIAPFGLATMLLPQTGRIKWLRAFSFSGGLAIGSAGLFGFFAAFPAQAMFDNFGFAEANITYRYSTGEPRTMTLLTKLRFFLKVVVRPDVALFVVGLVPLLVAYGRRGMKVPYQVAFLLLLLPFVFIGSFAPSPAFDQYFFPLVPFLSVLGLYSFASISTESRWFRGMLFLGSAAVALSVARGARAFHDFDEFFVPKKWEGTRLHARAQEIRKHVPSGKVLTLAPIYPLEAGLSIYPPFSTGPFAWRVSPYIEPNVSRRAGIVNPGTFVEMLTAAPPSGILVGFEDDGEEMLNAYGRRSGAKLLELKDDHHLWVPAQK